MKLSEIFESSRFEYNKKSGVMDLKTDEDQKYGLYLNGKLIKTVWGSDAAENLKKRDPRFKDAIIKPVNY